MIRRAFVSAAMALFALTSVPSASVDIRDTRLLHQPATNGTHVAFVYADDLWVARLDGTDLRRLTTDDGIESNPAFSPDGKTIAFSAQYDGNVDVYVVPAEGGVPKRLTWHPGADEVQGFTPGRPPGALHVAARGVHDALHAAVHGAARRWDARGAGAAECRERHLLARRAADRLQPAGAAIRAVEAISRRHGVAHLALRRSRVRPSTRSHSRRRAPTTSTRCGSATSSTSGPTVTASSTSISYDATIEAGATAHAARGLSGSECIGRRRQDRVRAGGLSSPLRSGDAATRKLSFGVPADLRETRARFVKGANWIRNAAAVAHRRARAVRVPRRDCHGAGGERRRAQSDQQHGRPRALAGVVAGWHPHRVLLRRIGRVRAAHRKRRTAKATSSSTS